MRQEEISIINNNNNNNNNAQLTDSDSTANNQLINLHKKAPSPQAKRKLFQLTTHRQLQITN
jgi:hypothetical protein